VIGSLNGFRLRRAARTHFGFRSLRTGQLTAMRALLRRRDALAVLPTGHGKSAIYQVPTALLTGPTIVISPLLALQQDQLDKLAMHAGRAGTGLRAVRVSSAQSAGQRRAALEEVRAGTARFLFITPELLGTPDHLAELRELRPGLVAVDEAHCVSAWGYDFRPDYLQLGQVIRELGRPPVVALTATASPPVREDIVARLGLRDPVQVVSGLDRTNLMVSAVHCPTEEVRWQRLLDVLGQVESPGIVYTPTRRSAEELADRLTAAGTPAAAYHGGLSSGERTRRHDDFLADRVPVMVATSAFGMGIDKPNIRFVIHAALPESPDSYLQEVGRAGRDGGPAQVVLLHRAEDVALRRYFSGGLPDTGELQLLAAALRAGPVARAALAESTGLGPRKLGQLLGLLEQVGGAVAGTRGQWSAPWYAEEPARLAELAVREARRHQDVSRSRTDMMRTLAETRSCRTQPLLAYFGEQLGRPCGHCDNCRAGTGSTGPDPARAPYPVHSAVRHASWGAGTVLGYHGDTMTVLFDDVGYKTLSVPVVERNGLLAPA
jgi:ATP-dependent DNA helicase RecQ